MMQLGYSHFTALRIMVNDQLLSIGKSGAVTYIYAVDNGTGKLVRNRLYHVSDLQSNAAAFSEDIDDQGSFTAPNQNSVSNVNYAYTEIGELQKDKAEKIDSIRWNVYGKVERIYYSGGKPGIQYLYDASGSRVAKLLKNINANASTDTTYASTYYWRDAQGNVLATESKKYFSVGTATSVTHATEIEYAILGAERLGVYQDTIAYDITTFTPYGKYKRFMGRRHYELVGHTNNVMATVSDIKTFTGVGYKSKVLSAQFYAPFGSVMNARKYTAPSYGSLFQYRYGMNGQEREIEINGSVHSAEYWMYDGRLGRRWNRDPVEDIGISSYAAFRNNPILNVDPDGAWPFENPLKGVKDAIKKRVVSFVKVAAVTLVKTTAQYIKQQVADLIHSAKIEPKAEATVSVGAQASAEIKKSAGFTRNLGSVDIASIKIGAEISAEGIKNTSEFKWIGKDGNIDVRQSLSQDLIIPTSAGAVGTGTEYENTATYHVGLEKGKLNLDKSNHTISVDKGVSLDGVNTSAGIVRDIKEDKTSAKGSVGVAGEVSFGIGLRGKAEVDVKVPLNK